MNEKRSLAGAYDELVAALVDGDERRADRAIDAALDDGWSPLGLYTGLLAPAQGRVGELWLDGRLNAAQEHMATEITTRQMQRLRAHLRPRPSRDLRAVVAAVEGDDHQVGARMVADFLYVDGWDVDFLGANVPVADLVEFVHERRSDLVGLSVTLAAYIETAGVVLDRLNRLDPRPRTIVGGAALAAKPALAAGLPADAVASDARSAVHAARRVLGLEDAASASLDDVLRELGRRVAGLRGARQISQARLAEVVGLDRTYISAVENGRQNLTIAALLKLADGLEVAPEELISTRSVR